MDLFVRESPVYVKLSINYKNYFGRKVISKNIIFKEQTKDTVCDEENPDFDGHAPLKSWDAPPVLRG